MNNNRYAKMIMYKTALDSEWKKRDPVSLYECNYDKTLLEAKTAGFKIMRNRKGDHKLEDTCSNQRTAEFMEFFAETLRGVNQ